MPGVPSIPASIPASNPARAHASLEAGGPDWDALPAELRLRIAEALGVPDLKQLRLVSRHWCEGVDARLADLNRCERACAAWIEHVASNPWCDPPRIDAVLAGDAPGLAPRFPHMALRLNLQHLRAALEAGTGFRATHHACAIPDLARGQSAGALRTASGEPVFVGEVEDDAGRTAIVLCGRDGTQRMPEALQGAALAVVEATVEVATSPAGRQAVAVQHADGRLALYFPETDHLERLPEAFTDDPEGYRPHVALSPDGRHVAAKLAHGLVAYDRTTGQCVRTRQGMAGVGLSVDANGDVFVGHPPEVVEYADAEAWAQYVDESMFQGFVFRRDTGAWMALPDAIARNAGWLVLSPDGRHLVKNDTHDRVVIAARTPGARAIQLCPDPSAESRNGAVAAGISPAGIVVAVAYGDRSLALFDLAGAAGCDAIFPGITLQLPPSAQGQASSLLFSGDASRLDVVYRGPDGAEFVRYDLG